MVAFDPAQPYRKSAQVALRTEPFGALAYHFGTRRLSFLKTPTLVEVVTGLEQHDDVHATLAAAGVPDGQRRAYLAALAELAATGTIERRHDEAPAPGAPAPEVAVPSETRHA